MKKKRRKLTLNRETIRTLTDEQIRQVGGGASEKCATYWCRSGATCGSCYNNC